MNRPVRSGRALIGLTAAALALPLIAACGGGSDPGGSDPTGAGSEAITVYSGRSEELVGPLFAQFTEQTGIEVQARFGDTAEFAAQLLEEGDASPADVYFAQDAGALGAVSAAGLLAPLPASVATLVPQNYRATDGTWTGVSGRARVIAYDAEQVPADQVPQSIFDLTDPQWQGQVAIAPTNASFQSFVTAMRVSQGDDVTRQWLEGLVANDVQTYEKNGLILDAVDTGQVQLGLINHYYWYEKAAEVGQDAMRAQISFTKPEDPGSLVNVAGVGILTNAADNAAAEQFVAWLLSPRDPGVVRREHLRVSAAPLGRRRRGPPHSRHPARPGCAAGRVGRPPRHLDDAGGCRTVVTRDSR